MSSSEELPVRQQLKVVTLMDCVAGVAEPRGEETESQPITIITLSHSGEIEQPMMLTIPDTEVLVTKLLESLADHGCEFADFLLDSYFVGDDEPSEMDELDDEI